jgi:tryptophan-rich sensory protein
VGKIKLIEIVRLAISIIVCQLAGFVGSIFTTPAIPSWYASLTKPSFTPPNWIFAPVWTTLFFLMGISAFLVWRRGLNHQPIRTALTIFIVQLILNTLWSIFFFGLRSPILGFIVIAFLWIVVWLTILNFFKVSKIAGLLLIPYLLWVSFAAILNIAIWRLNPSTYP